MRRLELVGSDTRDVGVSRCCLGVPLLASSVAIQQLPAAASGFHHHGARGVGPATGIDQQQPVTLLQGSPMAMAADDAVDACLACCFELGTMKTADQTASARGAHGQRTRAGQLEIPAQMLALEAMKQPNRKFFAAVEADRLAVELITVGHEQPLAMKAGVRQLLADPAASGGCSKPIAQGLFVVA